MCSWTRNPFVIRPVRWGFLLLTIALAMLGSSYMAPMALAGDGVIRISSTKPASVKIAKGKPRTIKTDVPFYEIVVGDPSVANINPLTDQSFYVLGNELGTTAIALFDKDKQMVGSLDVEVTLDTDKLASTIRDTVPDADITVRSANGRLVLSGEAKDAVDAEKAQQIATEFSGAENVINSVSISSSHQVQLNVRFVEINREVGRELGTRIRASYFGSNGGISINSDPKGPVSPTPAGAILGGLVTGGWSIDMAIKALEDRGIARRLAEPNLIARSGEKASFLAGGEYPIPVSEDNNKVTVTYKKYGVSLDFTPTVLKDGLISLDIEPEVSSVDTSASYQVGNISIPGFIVRRASTSVDLKSGQSFMIAGLLKSESNMGNERVPGLGQMPVLGALFSSKAYQRRETDLVMIVTPYLVKPIDPSKKPLTPMDQMAPGNDADFFLGNVEEVKVSDANRAMASSRRADAPTSGHFLDLSE